MFAKFVNFIKKDIEEEFSNLRDIILDMKKTKITVYDPKKGHIEMDIYLPLEMKSLLEIDRMINPLENIRSLIPHRNPLPSWDDIWSHAVLPNFGGKKKLFFYDKFTPGKWKYAFLPIIEDRRVTCRRFIVCC